jgi:hypothetical protein
MNYAVLKCSNGTFAIASEHGTDKSAARVAFFNLCAAFENAPDVITGMVMLIDENLDCVDNLKQFFSHPAPEAEEG